VKRKYRRVLEGLIVSLSLILTACGSDLKEVRRGFDAKVTALEKEGLVLREKREKESKTLYRLRMQNPEKISSFLVHSALGSSDPELTGKLAHALEGVTLEMEVDWKAYAEGKPGSVRAYLLPAESNATGALARLMRERKLSADLDFDQQGKLQRIRFAPLDEPVTRGKKTGRLTMRETVLEVVRAGETPYDQAYRFHGSLWKLSFSEGNATATVSVRGLACNVDTPDAYLGSRDCTVDSLALTLEEPGGDGTSRFLLHGLRAQSRVWMEKGEIKSEAAGEIESVTFDGKNGPEKVQLSIKRLKFDGEGGGMSKELYRRLVDLLSAPSASPEESLKRLAPLLTELFRKLVLGYRIEISGAQIRVSDPRIEKEGNLSLEGLKLDFAWSLGREINASKGVALKSLSVRETIQGSQSVDARLEDFVMKIRLEHLYNFMPRLMKLASAEAMRGGKASSAMLEKEAKKLGAEVLHNGLTLAVEPAGFKHLRAQASGQKEEFGAMDLNLTVTLAPNSLDPENPMTPMLALAFLKADGMLVLDKKDLERILPMLDPGMQMMVSHYAVFRGDKALFELRYDQGSLLINGKPLR
jgi:hypothetical protein